MWTAHLTPDDDTQGNAMYLTAITRQMGESNYAKEEQSQRNAAIVIMTGIYNIKCVYHITYFLVAPIFITNLIIIEFGSPKEHVTQKLQFAEGVVQLTTHNLFCNNGSSKHRFNHRRILAEMTESSFNT